MNMGREDESKAAGDCRSPRRWRAGRGRGGGAVAHESRGFARMLLTEETKGTKKGKSKGLNRQIEDEEEYEYGKRTRKQSGRGLPQSKALARGTLAVTVEIENSRIVNSGAVGRREEWTRNTRMQSGWGLRITRICTNGFDRRKRRERRKRRGLRKIDARDRSGWGQWRWDR